KHQRISDRRGGVLQGLDDLVARLLRVEPTERPANVEEVVSTLLSLAAAGSSGQEELRCLVENPRSPVETLSGSKSSSRGSLSQSGGNGRARRSHSASSPGTSLWKRNAAFEAI